MKTAEEHGVRTLAGRQPSVSTRKPRIALKAIDQPGRIVDDHSIAEQRRLLRQTVRRFVRTEIWLWEKRGDPYATALPAEATATLGPVVEAMGLSLLREPLSLGGTALDAVTRSLLVEEVAQHRAGLLAPGYGLFGPETPTPLYASSREQREQFLLPLLHGEARCFVGLHDPVWGGPPGTAPQGIRIRARRTPQGWMLDGTKLFVAGAEAADFGVVFARTETRERTQLGISCFLVETDRPGFQRWRPYPTIAVGWDTQELNLSNVRIPAGHLLGDLGQASSLAPRARLRRCVDSAAQVTGVGQAAQDIAGHLGKSGGDSTNPESVCWALADQETTLQSARLLTRQVAGDEETGSLRTAAGAWHLAAEAAIRVVDGSIGLAGPAGLSADLPLERWSRELRLHRWAAARAWATTRGGA